MRFKTIPSIDLIILTIPPDPLEFKLVDYDEIHSRYAKQYDKKKFKGYFQTILKNYKNQTQQFKVDNVVEPWTSRTKKSTGWHLLHDLLIDHTTRRQVESMTLEQVHKSNPNFECYELKASRSTTGK